MSDNDVDRGDLSAALAATTARTDVMRRSDFLFQVGDSEAEEAHAQRAAIPCSWSHVAGFGASPSDNDFLDSALEKLLFG